MTTQQSNQRFNWRPLAAVAVVLAILGLWMTQSAANKARKEAAQLAAEKESLEREIARLKTVPAPPVAPVTTAIPAVPPVTNEAPATVQPPAPPPVEPMVATPTGMAKPPRGDGLKLTGTHAVPVDGGLRATMTFAPTISEPLGIVAVVVRLPRDSGARILQFAPTASDRFTDVVGRVSEDGKFAMFHGTAEHLESLEFALSVSEPVVADVRGTCGVGPFHLDVKTTGAAAMP